jgi:hypothetical protein
VGFGSVRNNSIGYWTELLDYSITSSAATTHASGRHPKTFTQADMKTLLGVAWRANLRQIVGRTCQLGWEPGPSGRFDRRTSTPRIELLQA